MADMPAYTLTLILPTRKLQTTLPFVLFLVVLYLSQPIQVAHGAWCISVTNPLSGFALNCYNP